MSLEVSNSKSEYTVFVAPLLLETNAHNMCSRVLVVDVPIETQVTRTTNRDKTSADQVKKIISVQMDREERLKRADDVIENTGSIEELEKNVELLHQKYLALVNE
ncbi:MAG: dephospho-CoA kinase [Gammaproteobacteria bacterium]|nr:MAG: dephospho-CoA kinase [Gammaproteobacteria bacterium]